MILLDNSTEYCQTDNKTNEISYSFAKKTDIEYLVDFMLRHPKTAFCEWQDSGFIKKSLDSNATIIVVAKMGQIIVGVVIAGIMGTRATINHLAVDESVRNRRVGSQLANRSLAEIKRRGVQRAFLFVSDDNHAAMSFWTNHGFNPTLNETTVEKDL